MPPRAWKMSPTSPAVALRKMRSDADAPAARKTRRCAAQVLCARRRPDRAAQNHASVKRSAQRCAVITAIVRAYARLHGEARRGTPPEFSRSIQRRRHASYQRYAACPSAHEARRVMRRDPSSAAADASDSTHAANRRFRAQINDAHDCCGAQDTDVCAKEPLAMLCRLEVQSATGAAAIGDFIMTHHWR